MQALLPLVEQIRTHYLRAYRESLSAYLAAHSPSAPEVLFELKREAPYAFRLYRADMASNAGGGPEMQKSTLQPICRSSPSRLKSCKASVLRFTQWPGTESTFT